MSQANEATTFRLNATQIAQLANEVKRRYYKRKPGWDPNTAALYAALDLGFVIPTPPAPVPTHIHEWATEDGAPIPQNIGGWDGVPAPFMMCTFPGCDRRSVYCTVTKRALEDCHEFGCTADHK
jgi:hypothetical protein